MSDKTRQTDIRRDLVGLLPQIRRFAMALTGDAAGIDQLVMKACEEAVARSHLWQDDQRLDLRVFTLMRTLWNNGAFAQEPDGGDKRQAGGRPDNGLSAHPVLESLPNAGAPVYLLCAVEGLSYAQTASVMGITPDAVAVRMLLSRRELAAQKTHPSERSA